MITEQEINEFIALCQARIDAHHAESFPTLSVPKLTAMIGPKYIRIVKEEPGSRSVYCFLDRQTGDILKADGWKRPAKHARGNIRNGAAGTTIYGASYLR